MKQYPFKTVSMVLLSFDIFLDGYHRRLALANDAYAIRRLAKQSGWQDVPDIYLQLTGKNKVILITDMQQRIVFASSNMFIMNGYLPGEILGKSSYIFQGEATESKPRAVIHEAIYRLRPFHVQLTNYRKNGTPYLCEIEAYPMLNQHNIPVHFIAFENIIR